MKRTGMHGNVAFAIGGVTILVAIGALGFILFTVTDYSEKCKTQDLDVCDRFTGPSFPVLMIVLIIAGLVIVSSTVIYILIRS